MENRQYDTISIKEDVISLNVSILVKYVIETRVDDRIDWKIIAVLGLLFPPAESKRDQLWRILRNSFIF